MQPNLKKRTPKSVFQWDDPRTGAEVQRAIGGQNAQILRELIEGPVEAPSKIRIASRVMELRNMGLPIQTTYTFNPGTGNRFGTYHLEVPVREVKQ